MYSRTGNGEKAIDFGVEDKLSWQTGSRRRDVDVSTGLWTVSSARHYQRECDAVANRLDADTQITTFVMVIISGYYRVDRRRHEPGSSFWSVSL